MVKISNNFFKTLLNKPLIGLKSLFLILFFLGCSSTTKLNSSPSSSCFNKFPSKEVFDNYVAFHQEHADSNQNSMRSLGCAFYQQGNLLLAEQWLIEAYRHGHLETAIDLMAIYLKENQINLASQWRRQIEKDRTSETEISRWLKVIEELEKYDQFESTGYLENAKETLLYKMKYEGSTPITEQLITNINNLISADEECQINGSTCLLPYLNEQKSYIKVFSKGVLATLIPDLPLYWQLEEYDDTKTMIPVVDSKKSQS